MFLFGESGSNLENLGTSHSLSNRKSWFVEVFPVFPIAALYFFFPNFIALSHLALFILVIFFLVNFNHQKIFFLVKQLPILGLLLLIYVLVLAGVVYTPADTDRILEHLGKYARFVYPVILVTILWQRPYLQKIALNSFSAGMLFIVVSAWLSVWFVLPWSASKNLGWGQNHYVIGDHITQNVMMAFFAIFALHRGLHTRIGRLRFFWLAVAVLALVSITHLSHGRTGLLVLLAGLTAYAMMSFHGRRLMLIIVALLVLLLVAAIALTSSSMTDRLSVAVAEARQSDVNNESSIGHRLYNYKLTPLLIAEAPIFGHGTAAYHTEICRFVQPKDRCEVFQRHPHNQFLFMGADHGLVGMIVYGSFIIMLFVAAKKSRQLEARLLLSVLASILLLDSLVNSPFYSSRESQFFSYMVSLFLSMSQTTMPDGGSGSEVST